MAKKKKTTKNEKLDEFEEFESDDGVEAEVEAEAEAEVAEAEASEAVVVDETATDEPVAAEEVQELPTPPKAVVPEQTVIRRGTPVGGVKRMKRSEYDAEIAKERSERK